MDGARLLALQKGLHSPVSPVAKGWALQRQLGNLPGGTSQRMATPRHCHSWLDRSQVPPPALPVLGLGLLDEGVSARHRVEQRVRGIR